MTLFNFCVGITEKIIRQQTITSPSLPIVATLLDSGNNNITSTLFGVSSLSLGETYWTVTNNTVTNALDINFGIGLINYALPIQLRLTTDDGIILSTAALETVVEIGNELTLYSGSGVNFTFTFGSIPLSNAILNLIFKGVNTSFPVVLSAKYYDNNNTLRTTISLSANKWSEKYIGTLGEVYFEYGDTQTLPTINSIIDSAKITDASNNVWFDLPIALPVNLRPNSIIYSNSLVLRIPDPSINLATYIAPSNNNSVLYVDFNGTILEQSNNSPISTSSGIGYNSTDKLFGTECLICDAATNIQYANVVFPNQFTLNFFVRFTTAASGRTIVLAEKSEVFSLSKTSSNNLEIGINGAVVITTPWSPVNNTWQHIWVQKSATQLKLRVNSADINITTSYSTTVATNTNYFSVSNNILGLCNGIYLEDGSSQIFSFLTRPLQKRRYSFDDISFYEWIEGDFTQWKAYF